MPKAVCRLKRVETFRTCVGESEWNGIGFLVDEMVVWYKYRRLDCDLPQ